MIALFIQIPFYVVFGWFACICMIFAQRAMNAMDFYKGRFERMAREQAKLRTSCRDCIEWFETQHPIGEVYALGFLAFDDLKNALRPTGRSDA